MDARVTTADVAEGWRVRAVKQRAFIASGTAWAVVAPGCPAAPHPHRDCECKIFAKLSDALEHQVDQQRGSA